MEYNTMNKNDRAAFDRVAKRIKDHSEQSGKPVSITEARRELAKQLTKADNRKRQRS